MKYAKLAIIGAFALMATGCSAVSAIADSENLAERKALATYQKAEKKVEVLGEQTTSAKERVVVLESKLDKAVVEKDAAYQDLLDAID